MTIFAIPEGQEGLFYAGADPEFQVYASWSRDPAGQAQEQVHLLIPVTADLTLAWKITGPAGLSRLIDSLHRHRQEVWPDYQDTAGAGPG